MTAQHNLIFEFGKQSTSIVENIKEELKDVIKLIRFPTMTTTEFAEIMEKYQCILEWQVLCDIFCYIGDKRPMTAAKEFRTQKRYRQVDPADPLSSHSQWKCPVPKFRQSNV